jgi:hypothetical protein
MRTMTSTRLITRDDAAILADLLDANREFLAQSGPAREPSSSPLPASSKRSSACCWNSTAV